MTPSANWPKHPLPEVVTFNPRHERALPDDLEVSFVPMPAISERSMNLLPHQSRKLGEIRRGYTHFRDGDVLFAKITPCMENGKAAVARNLIKGIGCGTTELHVLRPNGSVLPEWVYYYVWQEQFRNAAEHRMTGAVGQERVPLSFLEEQVIPVPETIDEQRLITRKLDHIAASLDATIARLNLVPFVLKRFRLSIFSAAGSGRLTEKWRRRNRTEESADALLDRIKAARLAASTRDSDRRRIVDFFDAFPAVQGSAIGIPESWRQCHIGSIGHVCNGSTPSRQQHSYWGGNIPWVSSGEVQNCIIRSTRERITRRGYENSSVTLLPKGTVLIAMIGEGKTRGQSAILNIGACINQNIAAVLIDHGLIEPKYLWYWFQGQYGANREIGSGSGPQALNCQRVRNYHLTFRRLMSRRK